MVVSNTQCSGSTFTHLIKSSPTSLPSPSVSVVRCYTVINCILCAVLPSPLPIYTVIANYSAP